MVYVGKQKLGDFFRSRREKGRLGLPTLSVTLTNGLVDRTSLDRKTDTNLSDDQHLLVKKDDIAYNMMRMWQGASGLACKDGLVSPAYVVLAPTKKIDSLYASYLFKTQRMVHLFWAYSYGLTDDRLRLYYDDFAKIPVNVPSVEEQTKIAKLLFTWDKAIETTEKLIANSKAHKDVLLQDLISGRKRPFGLSGTARRMKFGSFCSVSKERCEPDNADSDLPCIELEHIESKTGRLLGTSSVKNQSSLKACFKVGDVLFGKLRPYLRKTWLARFSGYCSTEILVLRADSEICTPEYLQLLCQSNRFASSCHVTSGSKMPRAEWSVLSLTPFRLPPVHEQAAIVKMIANVSAIIEHNISKRDALVLEKVALMQQLLTGKRRVKLDSAA